MPTVHPDPITAIESTPASPEAVWGLSRLIQAEWSAGVELTISWPGTVFGSGTSAERRIAYTDRPGRSLKFTVNARSPEESRLLRHGLYRTGIARSLVPLPCDSTFLTATATTNVLTCPTAYRRLFPGGLVAVVGPAVVNALLFEVATVQSVTPTAITLTGNVSRSYPVGSRVMPLLECDVQPKADGKVTNGLLSAELVADEVPGPSALPPLANRGDVLAAFGTYNGVPVFDYGLQVPGSVYDGHQTADGWRRDNRSARAGQGISYELLGPRPRLTVKRTAKPQGRANAWSLLQMFDACRGQTYPVVVPEQFALITPLAVTATTVTVPASGPLSDWAAVPYLAVVTNVAGPAAVQVQPLQSWTRSTDGATDTLVLVSPLATATNVWRVAPAHLMRFDSPDLVEKWRTTTNLSLEWGMVEVLNEAVYSIANL